MSSSCEAVIDLLGKLATDEGISEFYADTTHFTKSLNELNMEYAEAHWKTALRCDRVIEEYEFKCFYC